MKTTSFMLRSILGTSRKCVTGMILSDYSYMPYGQAEVLTASFTPDPDGKRKSINRIKRILARCGGLTIASVIANVTKRT